MFTFFKGFPQHSVSHSSEQPNEEEGVGEEEREQVEGLHQAELRAAHQLSKSTGSIAVVVVFIKTGNNSTFIVRYLIPQIKRRKK
jgi:hypothetical protein